MNLNRQIKPFTSDGIPAYNAKFGEVIEAVNWLLKIRTINGKPISESDQGPIIDLSPVNSTQAPQTGPEPWLTDPNGVAAGWIQHDVCVNGNVVSKWFWGTP
jgi:hypothetical protein